MGLLVYTGRVGYPHADGLDVTRKSKTPQGVPFAPSWDLLLPVLAARRDGKLTDEHWAAYARDFRLEMLRSYVEHRPAWNALLQRERVVLLCWCGDPTRCHRTLLARDLLPKLGAEYKGEVTADAYKTSRDHQCHVRTCKRVCAPEYLTCAAHWAMVPAELAREVHRHYRAGQCADKRPSAEWLKAARAALTWIEQNDPKVVAAITAERAQPRLL